MTLPFAEWLPQQRWYAGRSRTLAAVKPGVGRPRCATTSTWSCSTWRTPTAAPSATRCWSPGTPGRSPSTATVATIGTDGDRTGYDALYDPAAARHLLALIAGGDTIGDIVFEPEPDVTLPLDADAAGLRRRADGSGDLRGLIERLDYLQWLGVDCLWLPPFYDSPLRDGGYDIRDFYKVLPEFGTVEDFVALLDAAHKRGIRVITDLVMNHTSDQHAVVPGVAPRPRRPVRRLLRVERHQRQVPRTPGSSSSTPRSPTGPSTRCAGSSTGTGSSPTSRT